MSCQQGEVPEDGTDRCCRAETPAVGPTLHRYVIHGCADVQMCDKVSILGANSSTWARRAANSRSLMVTFPVWLVSVTSLACVASEKGEGQMNHWYSGSW